MNSAPDDRELLRIELETLWESDERGRLLRTRDEAGDPPPFVVLATAADGYVAAIAASLHDQVATTLLGAIAAAEMPPRPSLPPPVLVDVSELLTAAGIAAVFQPGPSFLVPAGTRFPETTALVTSSDAAAMRQGLRAPMEANWEAGEWQTLLAGELGPWAVALDGDEVVAICHSARIAGQAAEAGVWTHPVHRRQGHAVTTTSAWAALIHETGRLAFYSTSAENVASRAVAARLGLRNIGWLWTFRPMPDAAPG